MHFLKIKKTQGINSNSPNIEQINTVFHTMEVSGKWASLWFLSYKDSYVKMSMTKDAEYVGGMYKRSWKSKYTWFGVCAY